MDALAGKGIEVGRQGGDQRFALAGLHFRNAPLMQNDTAHDLNGEVTHTKDAVGGFAAGGKGFRQNILKGLAGSKQRLEAVGFTLQGLVIHLAVMLLQRQHGINLRTDPL